MPGVGRLRRGRGAALGRAGAPRPAAGAVLLLPPNAYRADERAVVEPLPRGRQGRAAGRRLQQPVSTPRSTSTPALLARLHERGADRGGQGVHRRRPPRLRDRRARPGLDLLVGADDVLLELALAGAVGWVAGYPNALPAASVAAVPGGASPATSPPRCRSTARCTRCCAGTPRPSSSRRSSCPWTSPGRYGGPCRPPRVPLTAEQEAAVRAATEKAARGGAADEDASASSTPSTRTPRACRPASSPAASGVIPGATMAERRLLLPASTCDHIRTLLMNEPRGHAAMSGAILQPPTRPDADCGVLFIEVSGLPADVRARHHRRGHRAGRDRHGRGRRAGHHRPAGHPGRARRRRGGRSRTARPRR